MELAIIIILIMEIQNSLLDFVTYGQLIRSQKKNLNQNWDLNLGPPDFQPGAPNPGSGSNFSLGIL